MLVKKPDLQSQGSLQAAERLPDKKIRIIFEVAGILLAAMVICIACRLLTPQSNPVQTGLSPSPTLTQTAQAILPSASPASKTRTPKATQTKVKSSPSPTHTPAPCGGAACPIPTAIASPPNANLPVFSHVVLILLENHEFRKVVGNTNILPNYNLWVGQYTLLTDYYAITHPSLPNYLALIGGDTFGVHSDCLTCWVNAPSLPDEIEASGRTWRNYAEGMPSPCFLGNVKGVYTQAINPFIYFNPIRDNPARCDQNVVPLTQLDTDLSQGVLPDFVFITPNMCNNSHNCYLSVTDQWLAVMIDKLMNSALYDSHSLIAITFDEGSTSDTCCGLGAKAGGHIATLLISPLVKAGFEDATPYTHYSLLKTIETSWGLGLLGHAADPQTNLIAAPFEK